MSQVAMDLVFSVEVVGLDGCRLLHVATKATLLTLFELPAVP